MKIKGLIMKRYSSHPYHSVNFRGFRSSVPGIGTKIKYISYYITII